MIRDSWYVSAVLAAILLSIGGWVCAQNSANAAQLQSDSKQSSSVEKKSKEEKPQTESKSDSKTVDAETKKSSDDKSAASTYTVKKGPFKVELTLDGVFESKRNTELTIHPKGWSDWTVE